VDLLEETETRLDRLLKQATTSASSHDALSSNDSPLPEGVFRETREEKDLTWIRSIMRICSVGGEMEVRELVELLSATHTLSKDTIRSNVMAILQDSAVTKKGIVKFVKGISRAVPV
jgi:hypothetical protein